VLTIYKSNIPFPVARHKYIMKCGKDILQPFFQDLNKSVSPGNQLPLCKLSNSQIVYKTSSMCMLSAIKKCFLDILTLKDGNNGYTKISELQHVRNVMAHVQKPDFVFQRNTRFHLNRRGCQFSRLLADEEWGSADCDCIIFS